MPDNENAEKSYPIAPVADRLLAFIIDYVPFFLVPAAIIWFIVNVMKNTFVPYKTLLDILIAFQVLFFIYAAVFNSGGRLTLGKKMMGLKVVNKDGEDINIIRGALRSVGYLIGLAFFFIGFALAYITKNKRALQDYMAGSYVVSTTEKTEAQSLAVMFMAAVIAAGLAAAMAYSLFKAPSAQQKDLVARARLQVAKIAFLEEIHKQKYGKYTQDIVRLGLISGDAVQFRRDMQENLKRGGFLIGVDGDKYKITAVAKDDRQTKVSVENQK